MNQPGARSNAMKLFYFGSYETWEHLQAQGFRRRNEYILKALVESEQFEKIYVVHKTYALRLNSMIRRRKKLGKVEDIYMADMIPGGRRWSLTRRINQWLGSIILRWQTEDWGDKDSGLSWCYWPKGYRHSRDCNMKNDLLFDADHNILHDTNIKVGEEEEMAQLLKEVAGNANMVISGSRSMNEWFQKEGVKPDQVFHVRNGYALGHVLEERVPPRNERKVIAYIGVFSNWIDYKLFNEVVSQLPEYDFWVIGNHIPGEAVPSAIAQLQAHDHVHFLGFKPPAEVSELLKKVDLGLVLYQDAPWLDGDSMKIYDYLAAGVPVLTTRYHPKVNEDFNGLVRTATNTQEFLTAIREVLCEEDALPDMDRVYEFLQNSSWDHRIRPVLDAIRSVSNS